MRVVSATALRVAAAIPAQFTFTKGTLDLRLHSIRRFCTIRYRAINHCEIILQLLTRCSVFCFIVRGGEHRQGRRLDATFSSFLKSDRAREKGD